MRTESEPTQLNVERFLSTPRRQDARAQRGGELRSADRRVREFQSGSEQRADSAVRAPLFASLRLCAFALILSPLCLAAATNDLTGALQRGLFEEEANRNLDAAAQAYQAVSAQFDKDRKLAATAIFRLGEVYRKQGRTNDAVAQYERIVREFPDEQTLATLSRQNLVGLSASPVLGDLPFVARHREKSSALEKGFAYVIKAGDTISKILADYRAAGVEVSPDRLLAANPGLNVKSLRVGQTIFIPADPSGASLGVSALGTLTTDDEEKEIRRIQAMIQNSPDLINAPSLSPAYGFITPLCQAAAKGQLKVARFLLENGALINQKSDDATGSVRAGAPIHYAAAGGHKTMVELLAQHKADLEARDKNGYTPLHLAVSKGFQAVVETLVAVKADLNAGTKTLQTPLHLCADASRTRIAKFLIAEGVKVDAQDEYGQTPLMIAAGRGHPEIAKQLLAAKADPNLKDKRGCTALYYAAKVGPAECVKVLLDAKADPNVAADGEGVATPLHAAANRGDRESVKLLLEHGAKPNVRALFGQPGVTPLMLAASKSDGKLVTLLLKHKADPNLVDANYNTALLHAVLSRSPEVVRALLAGGANPDANNSGWTPIFHAVQQGDLETVKVLLANGADATVMANGVMTLLGNAVEQGKTEIVKALLQAGANVNALGNGGTALHQAVHKNNKELVELLLTNGADPNIRDVQGQTPLDYTKPPHGPPGPRQELAKLLRQHGALDDLPDFTRIRVTRSSAGVVEHVWTQGTNLLNRFTLLETITALPWGATGRVSSSVRPAVVPFPDFGRVRISRRDPKTQKLSEIPVDVAAWISSGECSNDFLLKWGDSVNIPDREHTLTEQWQGLPADFGKLVAKCLQRKVTVKVKGESQSLSLSPVILDRGGQQALASGNQITQFGLHFRLKDVLTGRARLFSTSDLTRVKVRRTDHATGQTEEWVFNEESIDPTNDLWLRDGDVIEVPDKP